MQAAIAAPSVNDNPMHKSLQRRYRTHKGQRAALDLVWDEIDYFTGPVKDSGSTASNPHGGTGNNLEARRDLWDHTAIEARSKLAASIHGAVNSSSLRWFGFGARDPNVARDQESATWLDDRGEEVWNDLQDSNFNIEVAALYHQLCGNGNGFMTMELIQGDPEDYKDHKGRASIRMSWQGPEFNCIDTRDGYFDPDRKGMVKTFWWRRMWVASQVVDHCEDKGIPVPEDVALALERGDDRKYEIVFCVFQRADILKKKKLSYPAPENKRPYGCIWWREDTGALLGKEGGYYENPIMKGIWTKAAGSRWGSGPSNVVLPTVKYMNGWREHLRNAGEKAVDPTHVTTERNILSSFDLRAGGLITVRAVDEIKPLESNSKFDVGDKMLTDDQLMVRRAYHEDQLELKDTPAMTATEAQIRYEWMNRLLGMTLGFIQTYILGPIVITDLQMRIRTGNCPPMPKKLKDAGGLFNIEYQGPLARSQRTDEVAAIERLASFVAALAQFYPEIRAALDPLEAVKLVAQRLGIPASLIPPDSVLKPKMEEIIQSMQQAQQADTEQKSADAEDKKASAAVKRKTGGVSGLGGNVSKTPLQYPGLPPKPNLAPGTGRVVGA